MLVFTNIDCKSNTKANKAWLLMNIKDNLCVHNCVHENYTTTVHCQEKYWMAHFNLTWELSLCDIQLFLSVGVRISSTVLHSFTFQISILKKSFDPIYLRQSSFLKFTRGNGQNHCHIATENLKDQKRVHTSNPISQKGNFPSGLMFCPHLESDHPSVIIHVSNNQSILVIVHSKLIPQSHFHLCIRSFCRSFCLLVNEGCCGLLITTCLMGFANDKSILVQNGISLHKIILLILLRKWLWENTCFTWWKRSHAS
jgi:hypothetical protein